MEKCNSARKFGELLAERMRIDKHFYLFSPDETTSNKVDKVYEVSERLRGMRREEWDLPEAEDGRIVELLSENTLFSMMVGHIMNGEQAMMTSYEAFFSIIFSQILQQIKFYKQSDEVEWRPKYPAVNLLSTSTCWRQDHNGYSHQSPAMISALLNVPSGRVNCLFPVDDVASEMCFRYMLETENVVNLTTFDKNDNPRWMTKELARKQMEDGGAVVLKELGPVKVCVGTGDIVREENICEPDVVCVGVGDITTREVMLAAEIVCKDVPEARVRCVNVGALTYGAIGTTDRKLGREKFDEIFGKTAMIVGNFHGYAETLTGIMAQYTDRRRLSIHGFSEEGSTTTPFEMLAKNGASRYDLAADMARRLGKEELAEKYMEKIRENHEYAVENGVDMEDIAEV